jgi:hypothetical protein
MTYDMPLLTEEQRAKLIERGNDVVKNGYALCQKDEDLIKIALAALNTKPVGFTTERAATYEVWNSGSASFWPANDMGDFALYGAPPVPVMKPIKLAKGALMVSMYESNNIDADSWLCLDKDGVIEAIKAAGGIIEGLDG